jgi:hypothetical protein
MSDALKDFRNFLYLCWDHLNLPDPTPVQYDIAQYIQSGPKRRCIQAFRGVGKSWITSAYVCHQLLMDPTINILVVSASKQRADDFSTFTLRLIQDMEILRHLMPHDNQRNSKIAFDVGPSLASHAPSVTSKGITSQITGSRADLIVADDVESLTNSATQSMRDKLSEAIKEFDAVLKPGGNILYLGTPQTEMSIYASLPERGYEVKIWPARIPTEKQRDKYGEKLAPLLIDRVAEEAGEPTDPGRFDEFDLQEREASYGKNGFALQFMLDTTLSDQDLYPLKLADLIVMGANPDKAPENPIWSSAPMLALNDIPCVGFAGDRYYRPMEIQGQWVPFSGSVMSIDPAGRGADETAFSVVKALNGYLYLVASGGLSGGYTADVLEGLSEIAKKHQVKEILIESNFGDGMFNALLQPVLKNIYPCTLTEVRHNTQKERRILDTLEPVMMQHRLCVDTKVIEDDYNETKGKPNGLKYSLFYQMTRLTRHKGSLVHDDRLDVLSMAVAYWTEQMAQDAKERMSIRKEEVLDQELERFMDSAVGRKPRGITWMNSET